MAAGSYPHTRMGAGDEHSTLTSVQLTQLCSPVWAPGSKNVLIDIDHSERLLELP